MAERIVHLFEVIQVANAYCDRSFVSAAPGKFLLQSLVQLVPVPQPCDLVASGKVGNTASGYFNLPQHPGTFQRIPDASGQHCPAEFVLGKVVVESVESSPEG